jgi:hypothetical protein
MDPGNPVGITVQFDPSLACEIKACDAIRLIQVAQDVGIQGDTLAVLLPGTDTYPDGVSRDSTRTSSGFFVDAFAFIDNKPDAAAERDPYYNGDDRPFDLRTTVGFVRGDTTNISRFSDRPRASDTRYPPNITRRVKRFEVCALCSKGEEAGRYYGRFTWRWSRQKGGTSVVDSVQTSRDQPSSMFLDALTLWASKRRFTTPRVEPPVVGGSTCP